MRAFPLSVCLVLLACAPKRVEPAATSAMTVKELQQAVARGPFPDDPCQAAWFFAVAGTTKAGERLDTMMAEPSTCAVPMARVRLVALARTDTLSWGGESRATDTATRLELAKFAAISKWEAGTSAVADLVNDTDEAVRLAAVEAVRALRQSMSVGALEKSLLQKPPRAAEERALLCTVLTEFNIDVPPTACRGLAPVPAPSPKDPVGKPPPNLCRTLITKLSSADAGTQVRALLELAAPWVQHRDGCAVPNEVVLRLTQVAAAPEVRAAAAMLTLWMHHPPDMRRTPTWGATIISPEAR
ncbi:MAG: hypothetical protein Q8L14_41955 [Myxococcales bacterium]|nr:hypothetical protein [Myxococcales bacterium]